MSSQPSGDDEALQRRRAVRDVLGTFLTGVTVLTTTDSAGRPRGITANSFTSVSLDPPLVLVCVDRGSSSYDAFRTAPGYAVNILGQQHQDLAQRFASKRNDKFDELATVVTEGGNVVLRDAMAWLDCRTTDVHVIGDHAVLIAEIQDFGGEGGQPLGFHQGRFVTFRPLETESLATADRADVSWIVEDAEGRVALQRADDGKLALPHRAMDLHDLTDEGLDAAAAACLGSPVTVDFLYSFYTDEQTGRLTLTYRGRLGADAPPPAGPCIFVAELSSVWASIGDEVERNILKRFDAERDGQRFGIYSGTSVRGSVATIHEVRHDPRPDDR